MDIEHIFFLLQSIKPQDQAVIIMSTTKTSCIFKHKHQLCDQLDKARFNEGHVCEDDLVKIKLVVMNIFDMSRNNTEISFEIAEDRRMRTVEWHRLSCDKRINYMTLSKFIWGIVRVVLPSFLS